jgi:hypothetical protein
MLPGLLVPFLLLLAFVHTGQFFACESDLPTSNENPAVFFETLVDLISFHACDDIPVWGTFILFMAFTMPLLFIIMGFVFQMFNSAVGAVVAIALGTVVFLLGLF